MGHKGSPMPLIGNMSAFPGMRNAVRRLLDVPSRVARRCVAPLNRKVAEMFNKGQDPYGNPLAALAASTVRRKLRDPAAAKWATTILIRYFKLMPGTFFEAMPGAGLKLTIGPNGEWAQKGAANRPVRKVAPDQGLPASWAEVVATESRKEAKAAIKR